MEYTSIYLLSLAGLTHDLGKALLVDESFKSLSSEEKARYSYRHARETDRILKSNAELFKVPLKLLSPSEAQNLWELLRVLGASHHNNLPARHPGRKYLESLQFGDRQSASLTRVHSEDSEDIPLRSYLRARLQNPFQALWKTESLASLDVKAYPRKIECYSDLLPEKSQKDVDEYSKSKEIYLKIGKNFLKDLEKLHQWTLQNSTGKNTAFLWLQAFEDLLFKYFGQIPENRVKQYTRDVSLYDHSKSTAALAVAHFLADKDRPELLFIGGDFFGIQDFIFKFKKRTAAKKLALLRGKSFLVSLISELSAREICKKLNLLPTSILLSSSGFFLIVSHNSDEVQRALKDAEKKINRWLVKTFFGEVYLGIFKTAVPFDNLKENGFRSIWEHLLQEKRKVKHTSFKHLGWSGPFMEIRKEFKNYSQICEICDQLPAKNGTHCERCLDAIKLGTQLKGKGSQSPETLLIRKEGFLKKALFDKYNLVFSETPDGSEEAVWSFNYLEKNQIASSFFPRNTYSSNETFEELATASGGTRALGLLKADIDDLGCHLGRGLPKERFTPAMLKTLSRRLDTFFSVYLQKVFKEQNLQIEVVFCGGDDLFLIGSWKDIIKMPSLIDAEFRKYTGVDFLNLSYALEIIKPSSPLTSYLSELEESLEKSKAQEENNKLIKNGVTVFDVTLKKEEYSELLKIFETLSQYSQLLSSSFLHRILIFAEQAESLRRFSTRSSLSKKDLSLFLEALSWEARLHYYWRRQELEIKKSLESCSFGESYWKNLINTYQSKLKVAIWPLIFSKKAA